jgi:hypothetical protein
MTEKSTDTPGIGWPPEVTVTVTVCEVPTGFVASAGSKVQLSCAGARLVAKLGPRGDPGQNSMMAVAISAKDLISPIRFFVVIFVRSLRRLGIKFRPMIDKSVEETVRPFMLTSPENVARASRP